MFHLGIYARWRNIQIFYYNYTVQALSFVKACPLVQILPILIIERKVSARVELEMNLSYFISLNKGLLLPRLEAACGDQVLEAWMYWWSNDNCLSEGLVLNSVGFVIFS